MFNGNHNGHNHEPELTNRLRAVKLDSDIRWNLNDLMCDCRCIMTRCQQHLDSGDHNTALMELAEDLLEKCYELHEECATVLRSRKLEKLNLPEIEGKCQRMREAASNFFQELNPMIVNQIDLAIP